MSMELIAFLLLSGGLLGTASAVLFARNPIYSALYLILSFLFLAGMYLLLNANFVAIVQVLVYAGAIMVLFLFVIMMLNLSDAELGERRWGFHKVLSSAATLGLAGVLVWAIVNADGRYLGDTSALRADKMHRLERVVSTPASMSSLIKQRRGIDADYAFYELLLDWRALRKARDLTKPEQNLSHSERSLICTDAGKVFAALDQSRGAERCELSCPNPLPLSSTLEEGENGEKDKLIKPTKAAIKTACPEEGHRVFCRVVKDIKSGACNADHAIGAGFAERLGAVSNQHLKGELKTPDMQTLHQTLIKMNVEGRAQAAGLRALDMSSDADVDRLADFYLDFFKLRALVAEKPRFEHGPSEGRYTSCVRLATVLPGVDPRDCSRFDPAMGERYIDACYALDAVTPIDNHLCRADSTDATAALRTRAELISICSNHAAIQPDSDGALRRCAMFAPAKDGSLDSGARFKKDCQTLVDDVNHSMPLRCERSIGQTRARILMIAKEESDRFDETFTKLVAQTDTNPVPGEWRGQAAYRVPGIEPSRYEQAVLDALGIALSPGLTHVTQEISAETGVHPEHAPNAEAIAQDAVGMPVDGVYEGAWRHAVALEAELEKTHGHNKQLKRLQRARIASTKRYKTNATAILSQLRAGKHRAARSVLLSASRAGGANLSAALTPADRRRFDGVLSALASPGGGNTPRRQKPLVHDEDAFGSVESVGRSLFTRFLLPFEVISVLLLAAILGAVVIAKRRT